MDNIDVSKAEGSILVDGPVLRQRRISVMTWITLLLGLGALLLTFLGVQQADQANQAILASVNLANEANNMALMLKPLDAYKTVMPLFLMAAVCSVIGCVTAVLSFVQKHISKTPPLLAGLLCFGCFVYVIVFTIGLVDVPQV